MQECDKETWCDSKAREIFTALNVKFSDRLSAQGCRDWRQAWPLIGLRGSEGLRPRLLPQNTAEEDTHSVQAELLRQWERVTERDRDTARERGDRLEWERKIKYSFQTHRFSSEVQSFLFKKTSLSLSISDFSHLSAMLKKFSIKRTCTLSCPGHPLFSQFVAWSWLLRAVVCSHWSLWYGQEWVRRVLLIWF